MGRIMSVQRPDLFTYLDHRQFLKDWFAWRKAENPRFSHRLFARLAGQSSPSLLSEVTKGRRNLTPATTAAFCKAMSLSDEEAHFFELLVLLDRASSDEDRNEIWASMAATRRFHGARRIEGDSFRYLSNWYIPAVRELATCPGFRADPQWISKALRPTITLTQARQALDVLQSLGMLQVSDDGSVRVVDATLVTPHEVVGLAVHNYHRSMLSRAGEAIERFRPEQRHLGGVTVAVPDDMLPKLKTTLAEFQERVLDLCDGAAGQRSRVYQVGLQLFPLSASLGSEEP